MFTGLVEESARVVECLPIRTKHDQPSVRLKIESSLPELSSTSLGASIAINGVCLTLVEKTAEGVYSFDVSGETLNRSNLGTLEVGTFVHLERPLQLGSPLGGHLVSGHVDGVCTVKSADALGDYLNVCFSLKGEHRKKIAPFLVEKGSIALDGVSLTVNSVTDLGDSTEFEIVLIPHTLSITWPQGLSAGQLVNVEADLLAKHFVRYQQFQANNLAPSQSIVSHVEL